MKKSLSNRIVGIIYLLAPFISIGIFFLIWLVASTNNPAFIPSPIDAFNRFIQLLLHPISKMSIFGHIGISLRRVLSALGIASVLGITFGLFLGWNKTFYNIFNPVFAMLRPIPPLAWIPLISLWFGIGEFPKILIVFIGSFVAIVINTYTGVKMVDPFIVDVGRSFGVEGRHLMFEIIIPSSLPAIFAGIKTSVSTGWMCILAAEMIASRAGLGFLIMRGMDSTDIPLIIVGMVLVGVTGAFISLSLTYIERWVCPWKDNK
ncbi:MAG: ABC transporter permease [Candidatus Humimicrobiaceae bacterium]